MMFHDAAPPRHRGRFASMSTTTSSASNQRRPLQQQKRTKSSASWRRRTKICVVALGVFVVFVNVVVFSRDSDARLMSSEDAKASFFGGREEEDEEDKRSKRRVQKKTTRTTTTRTTTTTDEDDFSEDTQPSLETALIGSSLAVESPTITSGFKSMSYPSLAEVGDSKHTFLVAFEGDWEGNVSRSTIKTLSNSFRPGTR